MRTSKKKIKLKPADLLNEIGKAKNMRPFRPFILHLTSGENLEIAHDEQIAINHRQNVLFVFGEEAYHILKPDEVASIVIPHAAAS